MHDRPKKREDITPTTIDSKDETKKESQWVVIVFLLFYIVLVVGMLHWMSTTAIPAYFYWGPLSPSTVTDPNGDPRRWHHILSSPEDANRHHEATLKRHALLHLGLALLTFLVTYFLLTPPFGRHVTQSASVGVRGQLQGWRSKAIAMLTCYTLPAPLAWCLQEVPTLLNIVWYVGREVPHSLSVYRGGAPSLSWHLSIQCIPSLFYPSLLLFALHYLHRSVVYPYYLWNPLATPEQRRLTAPHPVPLPVVLSATLYCLYNGRLQVLANLRPYEERQSGATLTPPRQSPFSFLDPLMGKGAVSHGSGEITACVVLGCFLISSFLFFKGMYINISSDYHLLSLRRLRGQPTISRLSGLTLQQGKSRRRRREAAERSVEGLKDTAGPSQADRYSIPYGGYFNYVSCPNYLGECIEWAMYCLVLYCCSSGGRAAASARHSGWDSQWISGSVTSAVGVAFSFFIYTLSNLLPRARDHHQWYRQHFGQRYDRLKRFALFPGVY